MLMQMLNTIANNPQLAVQNLIATLNNPQALHAMLTNPAVGYSQQMNTGSQNPLGMTGAFIPEAQQSMDYARMELQADIRAGQELSVAGQNLQTTGQNLASGDLKGAWDSFKDAAGSLFNAAGHQIQAVNYGMKSAEYADLAGQKLDQNLAGISTFLSPTMVSAMQNLTGSASSGAQLTQQLNDFNNRLDQTAPTLIGRTL